MVVNRTDYTGEAIEAAYSVLIELSHLLSPYNEDIVLVGGWVPQLLLPEAPQKHVGSLDVDLALNHKTLQESTYKTILEILSDHNYQQGKQPFIFFKKVKRGNLFFEVEVDFLSGEYGGSSKKHRTQKIQDMQPRKARGCDLAFSMSNKTTISGTLPDGGKDTVSLQISSIVPFLVMKAMALSDRLKEKDAWDLYYCIRYFPGGIKSLGKAFHPFLENSLVQEAIHKLEEKFASPEHIGPKFIADFEELINREDRAILQQDAYQRVNALLSLLK